MKAKQKDERTFPQIETKAAQPTHIQRGVLDATGKIEENNDSAIINCNANVRTGVARFT